VAEVMTRRTVFELLAGEINVADDTPLQRARWHWEMGMPYAIEAMKSCL
jgi:hypothetical protein